ncbi:hypothetical protein [Serratia phage vB_SmaM_Yaphecito]|uniref:Uncharacterized protein n=1 Tax=Serratia phage vB_SmaM_Yaphecito TaxID=2777368 RepID=A0A7T3NBM2_9CAUD|nr:hypothetical protein [Serratia phage vB_SmaM_Yaphecito]
MIFGNYKSATIQRSDVPDLRSLYIMVLLNSHAVDHLAEYAMVRDETTVGVFAVKPTGETVEDSLTIIRLTGGAVKFILSESMIDFTVDQSFLKRFISGIQ